MAEPSVRGATKHVLLGVTGGIAAFKSALLVRRLRERGLEVRCALTQTAARFVSPLTLEVLSTQPVYQRQWLEPGNRGQELHVTAGQWADVVCIAPATAHTLGRLALGLADDFLTTTALMHDGPVVVAPAMHAEMWRKPIVARHVEALRQRGVAVLGPTEGPLASGEIGVGRMVEPELIAEAIEAQLEVPDLAGRTILITAGPTYEAIDPVRFVGNRSSGKMGFAIAARAARRGATVTLVAGPVALATPAGVERIDVESALEMQSAVHSRAGRTDAIVMAAAVADYRPASTSSEKLKKDQGGLSRIELVENPDILAGLRDLAPDAVVVGFAAETSDLVGNAKSKLAAKRVDLLVANDVSRSDIGFGSDDNEVVLLAADGSSEALPKLGKQMLADRLLDRLLGLFERVPGAAS